ncbi:MAG: hypothetical protein PHS60_03070 [Zavarzinia sp.]|nr:hypothetical protein [Zavarzinia sp.]
MTDLSRIHLPHRPLAVAPPGAEPRQTVLLVAFLFVLGLGLVAFSAWLGPGLVADLPLRQGLAPVDGGRVLETSCGRARFLVYCIFAVEAPGADGLLVRDTAPIFFLSLPDEDLASAVVADPARPGRLTTAFALDTYWNRLGTFIATAFILLALTILGARRTVGDVFRKRAFRRAFATGLARPVALTLEKRTRWGWRVRHGEGKGRREAWQVDWKDQPLMLDPGRSIILGVTVDGTHVLPVDAGGRFIGLDTTEAMALHASVVDTLRHG